MRPSRKRPNRWGASRKSRAERLGGVSTTIRSHRACAFSWPSFSIAMYSCVPAKLDAMMLDMKRTFDDIVLAHADPVRAQQILANPFYISLSSSFAGTQEYMAMEKLGQLKAQARWDLIVVDTPPSRSALDFLDAPQRLGRFLDGRMIRLLLAPAKAGGRAYMKVFTVGLSMFTNVLTRIVGAQALKDLAVFVSSLESMFGGFRERAEHTYRLLKEPGTSFVVVAEPERGEQASAPLAG